MLLVVPERDAAVRGLLLLRCSPLHALFHVFALYVIHLESPCNFCPHAWAAPWIRPFCSDVLWVTPWCPAVRTQCLLPPRSERERIGCFTFCSLFASLRELQEGMGRWLRLISDSVKSLLKYLGFLSPFSDFAQCPTEVPILLGVLHTRGEDGLPKCIDLSLVTHFFKLIRLSFFPSLLLGIGGFFSSSSSSGFTFCPFYQE